MPSIEVIIATFDILCVIMLLIVKRLHASLPQKVIIVLGFLFFLVGWYSVIRHYESLAKQGIRNTGADGDYWVEKYVIAPIHAGALSFFPTTGLAFIYSIVSSRLYGTRR